jgi:DNA mismatch endonuclease (patch repair protein)
MKLAPAARKTMMSGFRKTGSRSTEWKLRSSLMRSRISGWTMNCRKVAGTPDFWFSGKSLAVFVDGCFWHGCSRCCRIPKRNRQYWKQKIGGNVARDRRLNRALAKAKIEVVRIWEHELTKSSNLQPIIERIRGILTNNKVPARTTLFWARLAEKR